MSNKSDKDELKKKPIKKLMMGTNLPRPPKNFTSKSRDQVASGLDKHIGIGRVTKSKSPAYQTTGAKVRNAIKKTNKNAK